MPTKTAFPNFIELDHPLIQHKLAWMRKRDTPTAMFRGLLKEISLLIGYEITREVPLRAERIETPLAPTTAYVLAGRKPVVPLADFEDAYQTQRVLHAATLAARERRAVKMSEVK